MTSPTKRKIADGPQQIVERLAEFIGQGHREGVVSLYHPECRVAMVPDGPPMKGYAGVRDLFGDFVANRVTLRSTVSGEMINGDTAILQGEWMVEARDGTPLAIEVAKRLDHGGWIYFIDCPIHGPKPIRS